MIPIFHINNYKISTNKFDNLLHDKVVKNFEQKIAEYVGAKYAVSFTSATNAIFLSLLGKNTQIKVPSIIPPVVLNAIITSNNDYSFEDNIDWVGHSYILHDFGDYKIVDSAQKIEKQQFQRECNSKDLMIFSFYPTKPIGSCDGGMIVSDDYNKIEYLRELSLNGMSFAENNWDRKIKFPGYKMYMNSIQAEIAMKNFESYEKKLEKLSVVKEIYNKEFGLKNSSNHLYRINCINRDEIIGILKNKKIQSGIHYYSLHDNDVYKKTNDSYPKSEKESKTTLTIPFNEKLTIRQIHSIINIINENCKT